MSEAPPPLQLRSPGAGPLDAERQAALGRAGVAARAEQQVLRERGQPAVPGEQQLTPAQARVVSDVLRNAASRRRLDFEVANQRTLPRAPTGAAGEAPRDPLTPQERTAANRQAFNDTMLGVSRGAAEVGVAFGTRGLSLLGRAAATGLGSGAIGGLTEYVRAPEGLHTERAAQAFVTDSIFAAGAEVGTTAVFGAGGVVMRRIFRAPLGTGSRVAVRAHNERIARLATIDTMPGVQPRVSDVVDSPFLTRVDQLVEEGYGGQGLRGIRAESQEQAVQRVVDLLDHVPNPEGIDLDAMLLEVFEGRFDAVRGVAASYYRVALDGAKGVGTTARLSIRTAPLRDLAREILSDERLSLPALQDEPFKNILRDILKTKHGTLTFEQAQRWRSDLFAFGQIFRDGPVSVAASKGVKRLTGELTQSMTLAAKAFGVEHEFVTANRLWSEEIKGTFTRKVLDRLVKTDSGRVAEALLLRGSAREVKILRDAIGVGRALPGRSAAEAALDAKNARETWSQVQGSYLWKAFQQSSVRQTDALAQGAMAGPQMRLVPDGAALRQRLLSRGDGSSAFAKTLFDTPQSMRTFNEMVKLTDVIEVYGRTPVSGGIALRVMETQAVLTLGTGFTAGVATGDLAAGFGTSALTGITLLLGQRHIARKFADPNFIHALREGISAPPGSSRAARASFLAAFFILSDSALADDVREQARQVLHATSGVAGVDPQDAERAARRAPSFIQSAKPVVTDRADVGGTR